uniref:uro-adherence factor A-like isoform X2 n=1 Tax=Myxine glutinosa TaxID=7769 RepID=UPI00358E5074
METVENIQAARLEATTERRRNQKEIEERRRCLEDEKLNLQHCKTKVLRERWLLEGTSSEGSEEPDAAQRLLAESEERTQQLEDKVSRLEVELIGLQKEQDEWATREHELGQKIREAQNTEESLSQSSQLTVKEETPESEQASSLGTNESSVVLTTTVRVERQVCTEIKTYSSGERSIEDGGSLSGGSTAGQTRTGSTSPGPAAVSGDTTGEDDQKTVTLVFAGYKDAGPVTEVQDDGPIRAELVMIDGGAGGSPPAVAVQDGAKTEGVPAETGEDGGEGVVALTMEDPVDGADDEQARRGSRHTSCSPQDLPGADMTESLSREGTPMASDISGRVSGDIPVLESRNNDTAVVAKMVNIREDGNAVSHPTSASREKEKHVGNNSTQGIKCPLVTPRFVIKASRVERKPGRLFDDSDEDDGHSVPPRSALNSEHTTVVQALGKNRGGVWAAIGPCEQQNDNSMRSSPQQCRDERKRCGLMVDGLRLGEAAAKRAAGLATASAQPGKVSEIQATCGKRHVSEGQVQGTNESVAFENVDYAAARRQFLQMEQASPPSSPRISPPSPAPRCCSPQPLSPSPTKTLFPSFGPFDFGGPVAPGFIFSGLSQHHPNSSGQTQVKQRFPPPPVQATRWANVLASNSEPIPPHAHSNVTPGRSPGITTTTKAPGMDVLTNRKQEEPENGKFGNEKQEGYTTTCLVNDLDVTTAVAITKNENISQCEAPEDERILDKASECEADTYSGVSTSSEQSMSCDVHWDCPTEKMISECEQKAEDESSKYSSIDLLQSERGMEENGGAVAQIDSSDNLTKNVIDLDVEQIEENEDNQGSRTGVKLRDGKRDTQEEERKDECKTETGIEKESQRTFDKILNPKNVDFDSIVSIQYGIPLDDDITASEKTFALTSRQEVLPEPSTEVDDAGRTTVQKSTRESKAQQSYCEDLLKMVPVENETSFKDQDQKINQSADNYPMEMNDNFSKSILDEDLHKAKSPTRPSRNNDAQSCLDGVDPNDITTVKVGHADPANEKFQEGGLNTMGYGDGMLFMGGDAPKELETEASSCTSKEESITDALEDSLVNKMEKASIVDTVSGRMFDVEKQVEEVVNADAQHMGHCEVGQLANSSSEKGIDFLMESEEAGVPGNMIILSKNGNANRSGNEDMMQEDGMPDQKDEEEDHSEEQEDEHILLENKEQEEQNQEEVQQDGRLCMITADTDPVAEKKKQEIVERRILDPESNLPGNVTIDIASKQITSLDARDVQSTVSKQNLANRMDVHEREMESTTDVDKNSLMDHMVRPEGDKDNQCLLPSLKYSTGNKMEMEGTKENLTFPDGTEEESASVNRSVIGLSSLKEKPEGENSGRLQKTGQGTKGRCFQLRPRKQHTLSLIEQEIREAQDREDELRQQRLYLYSGEEGSTQIRTPSPSGWHRPVSPSSSCSSASSTSGHPSPPCTRKPFSPPKPRRDDAKYANIASTDDASSEVVVATRVTRHKSAMAVRWEAGLYSNHGEEAE